MSILDTKEHIQQALKALGNKNLRDGARNLLNTIGYASEKRVDLTPNTATSFVAVFDPQKRLNLKYALLEQWRSVDLLFQLTSDEVTQSVRGQFTFSGGQMDNNIIESYLFFAIELEGAQYTRRQLAGITREVNKLLPMPVMLLFQHGDYLTLSIINRRLSKRDESQDVLEKVTLVKDILYADPIRAHIDILYDLSLSALYEEFRFYNFVGLHRAWEKRLDTYQLNERFYRDIANWYFWVLQHPGVVPPRDVNTEQQLSIFFIHLITRLIFCWFLQEKGLIPRDLFRAHAVNRMLKDFSPNRETYYKAVLQNLFFATLNQEIPKRGFRSYNQGGGRNGNRGVTTLYRYRDAFHNPSAFVEMLKQVPFINGGLFDCLDQVFRTTENKPDVRLDDFSEDKENKLCLPNDLFFGEEREADLSDVYQDRRRKKEKVRGLIEILNRYKFTVEENTPLEQEIALDPELLGKVFENLLASYNEDTRTTARKATGSFYTPREIVNYMVDETLTAYLAGHIATNGDQASIEANLRQVFDASVSDFQNPFPQLETNALIAAIDCVKVLDPACGSGAFPMGSLHRLVDLLNKLDPNNRRWKAQQLARARQDRELAKRMQDDVNRTNALREVDARIADIERSFDTQFHELDFARKLYLIENCIYGVDIQPIACQIAKLRFFIALIVDQKVDSTASNFGVRPLPNLEMRVVAADALIPIEKQQYHQLDFFDEQIQELRKELVWVRHEYFSARTPEKKAKCREQDRQLRQQIAQTLQESGLPAPTASVLAEWDPYDQNKAAAFFDPAWMFSVNDGFDVVLGNPPYVRQEQIKELKPRLKEHYETYSGTADLFVYFYERGIKLLHDGGAFSFISSNKWFRSAYGERLRDWVAKHTQLRRIINFGDAPVFTSIAYPCIVVLTKERPERQRSNGLSIDEIRVLNWQPGPPLEKFSHIFRQHNFSLSQESLKPDGWRLESQAKLKLLDRIRASGTPLSEYVKGRFYRGILTGLNEAFVIDRATRDRLLGEHASSEEIIKPFLRGRDVKRWCVEFEDQYLLKIESSENKKHPWSGKSDSEAEKIFAKTYPAIYEHFRPLRTALKDRYDQGKYFWELRGCVYWHEFEKPKVIVPAITDTVNYAADYQGFYSNDKTSIFIPPSVPYALAMVNSQVSWWISQQTFAGRQGGFYEFKPMYVSKIPIPTIAVTQRKNLESLVGYLLWLNREHPLTSQRSKRGNFSLMSSYFEQLLNGLVYELFFPEDLHAQKLFLFRYLYEARLPLLAEVPEDDRLARLHESFERIYDLNHPIRGCLFSLGSLETVRIIEGEA